MTIKQCKGCGGRIVWIKTAAGKAMPCDATPVAYWQNEKGKATIITPNGETVKADLCGELSAATGVGYIPHWATCPKAKDFKGGRQQ